GEGAAVIDVVLAPRRRDQGGGRRRREHRGGGEGDPDGSTQACSAIHRRRLPGPPVAGPDRSEYPTIDGRDPPAKERGWQGAVLTRWRHGARTRDRWALHAGCRPGRPRRLVPRLPRP